MSRPDIEGLRALVEKMSPGPCGKQWPSAYAPRYGAGLPADFRVLSVPDIEHVNRGDLDGIVALRNAAPALLDHIARLEAALGESCILASELLNCARGAMQHSSSVAVSYADDIARLRSLLPGTKETAP